MKDKNRKYNVFVNFFVFRKNATQSSSKQSNGSQIENNTSTPKDKIIRSIEFTSTEGSNKTDVNTNIENDHTRVPRLSQNQSGND